ncbi:MAG: hypothetical protein ISR78_07340 [Spirochaetia bacterium]|nr:hypothetical protein [Spirochaetia bacterium]
MVLKESKLCNLYRKSAQKTAELFTDIAPAVFRSVCSDRKSWKKIAGVRPRHG